MSEILKRSPTSLAICAIAIIALTLLDLWTKQLAVEKLSLQRTNVPSKACIPDERGQVWMQRIRTQPLVLIAGYLEFRYAENCGAAFGFLDQAPRIVRMMLFYVAAAIAIVALFWMYVRGSGGVLFAVSVPFVISGALGNFIDRIRYVYVVDFIRFHILHYFEWPTFNVADSAITVGVFFLLLDGFIRREGDGKSTAPSASR
jgi:signal peptidase II